MNTPRYAAAAASLLKKHLPTAAPTPPRERSIATIERAIVARARRRRWLGVVGALSVAAAVALAVQLTSWHGAPAHVAINVSPSGQGAALRDGETAQPLAPQAAVESGQRIETPTDGGASLRLSTGTSMTLAGSTSFRVDSQGALQRFSLQHGVLSAHVAKLTKGQRFIVGTPDAEVEVRGTRFRLSVLDQGEACGAGTRTRLQVTEGVVEVRARGAVIAVKAGELWPNDCNHPEAARSVAASGPVGGAAPVARLDSKATPSATLRSAAAERESALTPANDLYAEGVARHRQGDVRGALRVYQELLTRYPRSPLAENARVERMRLLAGAGEAGRAEARRYLERYPGGFAIKEAQQLAAEP